MWRLFVLVSSVCLCAIPALPLETQETEDVQDPGQYLNSFLVQVEKREIAEQVAAQHGFAILNEIKPLKMYHLYHPEVTGRSKRSAHDYVNRLKEDPRVSFAEQQITLKRVKREIIHDKQLELPLREISNLSMFYRTPKDKIDTRGDTDLAYNDPLFDDMWYLRNTGQTGGKRDIDLNVASAWEQGFTGKGVVVTILDDGIDHGHADIKRNYDPEASADFNDEDDVENDPVPNKKIPGNSHGTRCAGEVAAEAGNGVCGLGLAYQAKIGGIRILDGKVTDRLEAQALLYKNQHIDIMSASWGPRDNGATMEGPKKACSDALKKGTDEGRDKKGTIFVWATGNGGGYNDTCACDGYVGSPYSVSISSLSDEGLFPFFNEKCSSTMGVTPTGGAPTRDRELREGKYKINVVTTDLDGKCTENFEGTSSAAPLASGCIALVLQANPDLTWRDVQHIIALGSRIPVVDDDWVINGAGFHVNYKCGFGMLDCSKMVELAQTWKQRPERHQCSITTRVENKDIPSSGCTKVEFEFDGCQGDKVNIITDLEHVELTVKIKTGRRGNTEIFLTSPSGTRSVMLKRRDLDSTDEGIDFTFMTVHNWGEDPAGTWTLEVCDNPGSKPGQKPNKGTFESWSLRTSGFMSTEPSCKKRAYIPTAEELKDHMEKELDSAKRVVLKRAKPPFGDAKKDLSDAKKELSPVDKKKVTDDMKTYYGFLKEVAKVFSTRELEDLGINSRDLAAIYDDLKPVSRSKSDKSRIHIRDVSERILESRSKSNGYGGNAEGCGYDYKRGYNINVFDTGIKRHLNSVNNERRQNNNLVGFKRGLDEFLGDDSEGNQVAHNRYIDEYNKRKASLDRQKRINSLLQELEEYLNEKK